MPPAASSPLAFEDRGTGQPLVFIHGLTFSGRTWDPVLDILADRHRCVAIDLPGHGNSPGLPASMNELLQHVHLDIIGLGIEQPTLIGHSFGGIFATIYAGTFPAAGVVNVDQPLDTRPFIGLLHQIEAGLRGPDFARVFEPIRQSIGVELLPEPLRSTTLATQTIRQDLVLAYWGELFGQSPDTVYAMVTKATARIATPYLAIFGHTLSDAERTEMRALLPQIQIEEWPGMGHMVHLMDPTRVADRIDAFLAASAT